MKDVLWKIGVVFFATVASISGFHLTVNSCFLKYEKDVSDKPDIFVVTSNEPGLCRINSYETSSAKNYHKQVIGYAANRRVGPATFARKEILLSADDLMKMNTFRGLNYDASEESILYLSSKIANRFDTKLHKQSIIDSGKTITFDLEDFVPSDCDSDCETEETDLAYDWITKNVYINTRKSIYVVRIDKPGSIAGVVNDRSEIMSPVVHPSKGYLFFIDAQLKHSGGIPSVSNAIYRADIDGSNIVQIGKTADSQMASLTIDFHTDRLYWSLPDLKIIQHSKLDGSDVKSFRSPSVYFGFFNEAFRSIALDKDYVYFVHRQMNSVLRRRKTDDQEDNDFRLKGSEKHPIVELMVYDIEAQKVRKDHPCLHNNGGCQKFCFAVPKSENELERVCRCSKEEKLAGDGVSCEKH